MTKEESAVQPEKTSLPRSERVLGRFTSVSESQDANALSPRDVSESDSFTFVRLLHSENASGPIDLTESGISMETREEQDWKVE